jgi:hypothetical protein
MPIKTYRFNSTISAIRPNSTVTQLPLGAEVLIPDAAEPDSKGMTSGTYLGYPIMVFQQDLDEQAEPTVTVKLR